MSKAIGNTFKMAAAAILISNFWASIKSFALHLWYRMANIQPKTCPRRMRRNLWVWRHLVFQNIIVIQLWIVILAYNFARW